MPEELSSTLEDYLAAIYRIEEEKKVARPRDISKAQNVARSTVTAALQRLADKDFINYEPYEVVTLTEKGRKEAKGLVARHRIISDFLGNILGVPEESTEETTCGMEHAIDPEVLEGFVCFLAFMRRYSLTSSRLLADFRKFAEKGAKGRICRKCVEEYMGELGLAQ